MKTVKEKLILKKSDYDLLIKYVYSRMNPGSGDYKNAEQLYEELKTAKIYEDEKRFPGDAIGLHSLVEVEEKGSKRLMKFKIVLPPHANMSQQRLSIFAPLSIALMGYRKGQEVSWDMPSGEKRFMIKNVINEAVN